MREVGEVPTGLNRILTQPQSPSWQLLLQYPKETLAQWVARYWEQEIRRCPSCRETMIEVRRATEPDFPPGRFECRACGAVYVLRLVRVGEVVQT